MQLNPGNRRMYPTDRYRVALAGSETRQVGRSQSRCLFRVHALASVSYGTYTERLYVYRSGGFFCTDCPKLNPVPTAVPPPTTSKRAGERSQPRAVTKRDLIRERSEKRKKARAVQKREGTLETTGLKIRGRWAATPTRRQTDGGVGSAFDGSQGVDSEDILGIPEIGFSSFQLFPDQDSYPSNDDPSVPAFNQTVDAGVDWIKKHAAAAAKYGKPTIATGFGLVTSDNEPDFVPFNSTQVSSGNGTTAPSRKRGTDSGVTDAQRDDGYQKWIGSKLADSLYCV